jgi:hypothetical protein
MSRTLTLAMRQQLFKRSTAALYPILLEIDHADMAAPVFLVNNTETLTYGGDAYLPFAFRLDPPDETEDSITGGRLTIDAVDQSLIENIRSLSTSPTLVFKAMFYYDASGVVTFEPLASWEFTMRNVTYDVSVISAELVYEDRLDNQMGPIEMSPYVMPGIF